MNSISTDCPECGHCAVLFRRERHHRQRSTLHFACTNLYCGARFTSQLTFSHITKASRSAAHPLCQQPITPLRKVYSCEFTFAGNVNELELMAWFSLYEQFNVSEKKQERATNTDKAAKGTK